VSSKPSQTRRLFESGKSAESVDPRVPGSPRPAVPFYASLQALGLLVIFLLLICNAGRAGLASLMASYGSMTNQLAPANAAVVLCQTDPDAHYLRGTLLLGDNDLPGAIKDYEQAASLRPDDYVLWLSLAHARELNGDIAGALTAVRQAVRVAPYYAQPRWDLGNILLRAGERDEAFKELKLAGTSNPTLMPAAIDLAWQISGGNTQFVERAIQPQTPEAHEAMAQYFRKRGEVTAAIAMFRAAGPSSAQQRRAYLADLISAKRFKDAYALWTVDHPSNTPGMVAVLVDPGFEEESNLDDPGFGWRGSTKAAHVSLSLDTAGQREGHASLKVEFNGESDPAAPVIAQLVLVEPHTHYQLRFAARTEEIVSGGLPGVVVIDSGNQQVLGQSGAFPQASNGWRDDAIEFDTGEGTEAVQITVQRQRCSRSPCPIFGRLWLDNFSLRKP
jgi:Flp pilus assembly protein TadD